MYNKIHKMKKQNLSEEFLRMQKLAGILTESQLNEALNKDIKVFGQDLDKNLKAAGFQTLILVGKSVSDEQEKIINFKEKLVCRQAFLYLHTK
jgi:hypothetical protein